MVIQISCSSFHLKKKNPRHSIDPRLPPLYTAHSCFPLQQNSLKKLNIFTGLNFSPPIILLNSFQSIKIISLWLINTNITLLRLLANYPPLHETLSLFASMTANSLGFLPLSLAITSQSPLPLSYHSCSLWTLVDPELRTAPLKFFLIWLHPVPRGILVPRPGIRPVPYKLKVQSLNHWTREVPCSSFLSALFLIDLIHALKQCHYIEGRWLPHFYLLNFNSSKYTTVYLTSLHGGLIVFHLNWLSPRLTSKTDLHPNKW